MNVVNLQSFKTFVHYGEIGANEQRGDDDIACLTESGEVTQDNACASWASRTFNASREDVSHSISRNNEIRQKFLESLLNTYGTGDKRSFTCLPSYIRKALKGTYSTTQSGDFGLVTDLNGECDFKVTSGKPLTARRIRKVFEAIDAETAKRRAVLPAHQDPVGDTLMRQSAGSALCYVNSIINAMKQTKQGQDYLAKQFTPNGCTLHAYNRDTKVITPYQYSYSNCKNYPKYKGEEKFSPLEHTMLHHTRTKQGNVAGGGNPQQGAQMLGFNTMSKTDSWPFNDVMEKGYPKLINEHLRAGRFVIFNTGKHWIALTKVNDDGSCNYLDDVDLDGKGQIKKNVHFLHDFDTNELYVVVPPYEISQAEPKA